MSPRIQADCLSQAERIALGLEAKRPYMPREATQKPVEGCEGAERSQVGREGQSGLSGLPGPNAEPVPLTEEQQDALRGYWDAQTWPEYRAAYAAMRALGLPAGYGEDGE